MVGRWKFRIWNLGPLFSGANLLFLVLGVVYFLEWFSQRSRFHNWHKGLYLVRCLSYSVWTPTKQYEWPVNQPSISIHFTFPAEIKAEVRRQNRGFPNRLFFIHCKFTENRERWNRNRPSTSDFETFTHKKTGFFPSRKVWEMKKGNHRIIHGCFQK